MASIVKYRFSAQIGAHHVQVMNFNRYGAKNSVDASCSSWTRRGTAPYHDEKENELRMLKFNLSCHCHLSDSQTRIKCNWETI
jgi:hypothetical protein